MHYIHVNGFDLDFKGICGSAFICNFQGVEDHRTSFSKADGIPVADGYALAAFDGEGDGRLATDAWGLLVRQSLLKRDNHGKILLS
jgi:hypothetical protein